MSFFWLGLDLALGMVRKMGARDGRIGENKRDWTKGNDKKGRYVYLWRKESRHAMPRMNRNTDLGLGPSCDS
jgi:hypothetical protein